MYSCVLLKNIVSWVSYFDFFPYYVEVGHIGSYVCGVEIFQPSLTSVCEMVTLFNLLICVQGHVNVLFIVVVST